MQKIPLYQFLFTRLKEMGIKYIFGVPGDYNLSLLNELMKEPGIIWVGNCNELNAAYACDGYSRIQGCGALMTVLGVGELSALNGIAGAFVEQVPIIHIVGMPPLKSQTKFPQLHHSLGNGQYDIFSRMCQPVTSYNKILTPDIDLASTIDEAFLTCWQTQRPVYLGLPMDVAEISVLPPQKLLEFTYPTSNSKHLSKVLSYLCKQISQAKNPIVLIDNCSHNKLLSALIDKLIEKTQLPFAVIGMGKGALPEDKPTFIGMYKGAFSQANVQAQIESSDCLLVFNPIYSDFAMGGFSANLPVKQRIEIYLDRVCIDDKSYDEIYYPELLSQLTSQLNTINKKTIPSLNLSVKHVSTNTKGHISQNVFWEMIKNFVLENDIIIADTGTSLFGSLDIPIRKNMRYIFEGFWFSIGYTIGATLGVALADPRKRVITLIGDGSLQVTVQEISTMLRYKINPIIFLINNNGYTIERFFQGMNESYNDIQNWQYHQIPTVFDKDCFTTKVTTISEFQNVLDNLDQFNDKLRFIEIIMEPQDAPKLLVDIATTIKQQNQPCLETS